MIDYRDKVNEDEGYSNLQESVVSMNVRQTHDFFEKHFDPNAAVDNALSVDEGFNLLRSRIETK